MNTFYECSSYMSTTTYLPAREPRREEPRRDEPRREEPRREEHRDREERRKRQYDSLAATADIDHDDDPETIRKQLHEARRTVAARRNKSAPPS